MSPSETALRGRLENTAKDLAETARVLQWAAASAPLVEIGQMAEFIPWHFVRGPADLRGPLRELYEIAEAVCDELECEHARAERRADDTTVERIEEERAAVDDWFDPAVSEQ